MIAKKVTYEDYNGESRTETHYFNLTKAEIAHIQLQENGNFIEYMQRLLEKRQIEALYSFLEDFVKKAYGEKSLDGSRFVKTEEMTNNFVWSPAFSEIVMELVQNPDKMQEFILGVIPKSMRDQAGKIDVESLPTGQ